jgi:hypothetical protein
MSAVKYQLKVKGLSTPDGTIPVRALLDLLRGITDCAEKGLRLAIEGASVKAGRPPAWLEKAVNLTFSGLEKGSTILDFEAPELGDVIGPVLHQQDFWVRAPLPTDTAITLFARSVHDTTAENLESEYYDAGLLSSFLDLKPFFKTEADSVELVAKGRPHENLTLGWSEMEKAERLKIRTPDSQAFLISGHLDAIQHSSRRFQLVLPGKQPIPGRINEEFLSAENLRQFWGTDVTIKGMVHFRPSGSIKLLEAHLIKQKENGEEVFEELPVFQTKAEFVRGAAIQAAEKKDWLKDVWGRWPGDETIEDLLEGLRR